MVYSLFTDLDRCTPEEVQRLLLLVPEEQRVEALKFKHTFGQFATLKSYLMLEELLAGQGIVSVGTPLRFETNTHGKPHLVDYPHVHFNISHCPKAIAVAVDDKPIGVDVERFVTPSDSLLNYCMNDDEVRQVRESDHPEATIRLILPRRLSAFGP